MATATATKLSTCFVSNGLCGVSCGNRQTNVRFLLPSQRLLPVSCKMRHRDLSLLRKSRQVKKAVPEQPLPTSGDEASESEDGFRSLSHDVVAAEDVRSRLVNGESVEVEDGIDREIETHGEDVEEKHLDSQSVTEEMKSLAINVGGEERHSGLQHGDLVGMIRSAEKNILILNEARVHALGDLDEIVSEKDVLQREISALEMRLAENDAKMRIAAQEKIRVELMESQLEKLKNELSQRTVTERNLLDTHISSTMAKFKSSSLFAILLLLAVITATVVPRGDAVKLCQRKIPGRGTCEEAACEKQCAYLNAGVVYCMGGETKNDSYYCHCTYQCSK